ncbi:MAG: MoaD/ThiS family protein [Saprospirales bacterium]|nr:MAG: MoaD/ThiS family protein [Saprospirales bacterium]
MDKQKIKIRAFGLIAEKMETDDFDLEGLHDTDGVRMALLGKFPSLEKIDFAIAVDKELIDKNTSLKSGAEVALLPPFSGG